MTNNTREALRAKIREAMTCDDREHLDSEDYEACYNCQIDKVMAAFDTATKELVREAEINLLQSLMHPSQAKILQYALNNNGVIDISMRQLGTVTGIGDNPQKVSHHLQSLVTAGIFTVDLNMPFSQKTRVYRLTLQTPPKPDKEQ